MVVLFLLLLYTLRGIFFETASNKTSICPKIDLLTLLIFYAPLFLIGGFVQAILAARKRYGPTFCLHFPGMKRCIFFITGSHGRNAVSKNVDLRLPAAQVAQVFGISEKTVGKTSNYPIDKQSHLIS